ncbi:MAG: efflux RND transporter permease subunit, partial [Cytophagia bacterium]|nr:efflux RND transporter permease subunit [Cytophagia bacterium]
MASLSTISIQRPVLALVMNIIIVIFGIIGFTYLGVREFPSVDPPVISVSTSYTGANAEIIEAQITEPIEEALNSIAGIKSLTSSSRDGGSSISAEFDLGVDLEVAANDVRDKVSGVVRRLPPDVEAPTVRKADSDASPIIFLNVFSKQRNLLELSQIAETILKERVQTIQGVSSVQVWGEKRYSMRLWMDPDKLAAYELTPLDVQNAVNRDNVELPSGSVEGSSTELTVRTVGRINSPEEFNDLIVKEDNGIIVRFRDIGHAELAPENQRTILKRDGVAMVGIAVINQPGSNQIEIADAFYKRIEQVKKDLPEDIELGMGFDNTEYIRESITEVQQTIIIAFALVVVIIFAFLRDWRTT